MESSSRQTFLQTSHILMPYLKTIIENQIVIPSVYIQYYFRHFYKKEKLKYSTGIII